jgi:hypothetical protein
VARGDSPVVHSLGGGEAEAGMRHELRLRRKNGGMDKGVGATNLRHARSWWRH